MEFTQIEEGLKALNNKWYLAKKRFFEQEEGYDPETKRIKILVEVPDYAISEEDPDSKATDYISFLQYCWKSDFKLLTNKRRQFISL
jgi:hypothetical protein